VAGPGTGKTRTLTHRLAHLIARHGARPEQCLALTFSRRAAGEMVDRLLRLLPEQGSRVPVMTFHALGLSLLRENGKRLGLPESVRVAGELERARMLQQSLGVSQRGAGRLLRAISQRKRRPEKGDKSNLPGHRPEVGRGPEGASHKLDLSPFSGSEGLRCRAAHKRDGAASLYRIGGPARSKTAASRHRKGIGHVGQHSTRTLQHKAL